MKTIYDDNEKGRHNMRKEMKMMRNIFIKISIEINFWKQLNKTCFWG